MAKSKRTVWNLIDALEGDNVVWCIALMLLLISIVCIFSSTSRLTDSTHTRIDLVRDQLIMVGVGLALIIGCYSIRNIKIIRGASAFGFIVSAILLLLLLTGGVGPIKAARINGATRTLNVLGVQIHVFEIVKVAMVMYLSWAVDAIRRDRLPFLRNASPAAKKGVFIYLPFLATIAMILPGSNSSAVFIGGIMFLTIFVGSGNIKDTILLLLLFALFAGAVLGIYSFTSHRPGFEPKGRLETAISRLADRNIDYVSIIRNSRPGSDEYRAALDKITQPYSAKIAIHQGGFFGKGPGQSTQRYAVPDMSEDFMFSFIIEEYGLLGAAFIIALFATLLSRGSRIAGKCDKDVFAKSAVAGLTLLITGQAFMHMFVNVGTGPLTGQTLPLVSHGNSALICFSIAFGILLSISRIASEQMKREEMNVKPLFEQQGDIADDMSDLDALESGNNVED